MKAEKSHKLMQPVQNLKETDDFFEQSQVLETNDFDSRSKSRSRSRKRYQIPETRHNVIKYGRKPPPNQTPIQRNQIDPNFVSTMKYKKLQNKAMKLKNQIKRLKTDIKRTKSPDIREGEMMLNIDKRTITKLVPSRDLSPFRFTNSGIQTFELTNAAQNPNQLSHSQR